MDRTQCVSALRAMGFKGSFDGAAVTAFLDEQGVSELVVSGKAYAPKAIAEVVGTKTVYILPQEVVATDGEDVVMGDPPADAASDTPDEEDMGIAKTAAIARSNRAKQAAAFANGVASRATAVDAVRGHTGEFDRKRKAYDHAIKTGRTLASGHRPVFSSGEEAERTGAELRLMLAAGKGYAQRANDLAIVGKTHVTYDNTLGGATVPGTFSPEVLSLFAEYGIARRVAGVTNIPTGGTYTGVRERSAVTVVNLSEGQEGSYSTTGSDNYVLYPKTLGAFTKVSNQLLRDSAINIADFLASSIARAVAQYEDNSYFLGENGFEGVLDKIDSDATFDAALSTGWGDYTIEKFNALEAKLPSWAYKYTRAYVMSRSFYHNVIQKFTLNAGGNRGEDIAAGYSGQPMFNGTPVFFSSLMPNSYTADQISVLYGSFTASTKIGVVEGSEALATSEHVGFNTNTLAFRFLEDFAITCHDVGGGINADGEINSGIVALKD